MLPDVGWTAGLISYKLLNVSGHSQTIWEFFWVFSPPLSDTSQFYLRRFIIRNGHPGHQNKNVFDLKKIIHIIPTNNNLTTTTYTNTHISQFGQGKIWTWKNIGVPKIHCGTGTTLLLISNTTIVHPHWLNVGRIIKKKKKENTRWDSYYTI